MRSVFSAFFVFTVALLCASTAHAFTITMAGLAQGLDQSGDITGGGFNITFSDLPFTLTFNLSDPTGLSANGSVYSSSVPSGGISIFGIGMPPPYVTVDGPAAYSEFASVTSGTLSAGASTSLSYHGGGLISLYVTVQSNLLTASLLDAYTTSVTGGGSFLIGEGTIGGAIGSFTIQTLTLNDGTSAPPTQVAAVPELSTWAMMLFGFCGLALFSSAHRARVTT